MESQKEIRSPLARPDTELAPRFYFGISLNAQIFQTVLNIGSDARVPR
jgi:hypothetical protein